MVEASEAKVEEQEEQEAKEAQERDLQQVPLQVKQMLEAEATHIPETSTECFDLLVAEANRETKRLEGLMDACASMSSCTHDSTK